MFSHVTLGIDDIDRAVGFYRPLMEELGWEERFATRAAPGPWAGWQIPGRARPLFIVARPADRAAPAPATGATVAFTVASRAAVDAVHALALALGGTDAGAPAPSPADPADSYGACFRDLDGNRLCVVCHGDTAAGAAPG